MNQRQKRRHFQDKVLFTSLLFLICFVIFSTIYWCVCLYAEQKNSRLDNLSILAQQGDNSIDQMLTDMNEVLYMHNNSSVKQILLKDHIQESSELSGDRASLLLLETGIIQMNRNLIAINYIGQNGIQYCSATGGTDYLGDISYFIDQASAMKGSSYIGLPFSGIINGERKNLLPISKQLIDISTGKSMGYIVLYLNFWELCMQVERDTKADLDCNTIILKDDQILYATERNSSSYPILSGPDYEAILLFLATLRETGSNNGIIPYQGQDVIISGVVNAQSHWTIIKYTPDNFSFAFFYSSILPFLAASFFCLAILSLLAYRSSRQVSKDINRLHQALCVTSGSHLKKLSEENLSNDEIGDLTKVFNQMIQNLNESINKEYIAKINEKDMQIRMLNYQINPHFLYNCLNLISSIARLNDVPEICKISKELGNMFHYSLASSDFVTISDELAHIQNYLSIQYVRFPDMFCVIYHTDETLLGYPCPKFILQPIVENCFSHGFTFTGTQNKKRVVDITVCRQDKDVCVTIVDNGFGIPQEKLDALYERLYTEDPELTAAPPGSSIGLWNVNQRIKAYFGPAYGLEIESQPNMFTCVQIKFPIIGGTEYERTDY